MNLLLLSLACTRAPIEDRWSHGSITQLKDSFTSNFVIESTVDGAQQWIVIDTGFNKNSEPLLNFLEEQAATIDDIQTVVLTHGHGDHVGAHANFNNATFYIHSNDKDLLLAEEASAESISTFEAGTELTFGNTTILPFLVPGHTAGNLALLVNDVLIMGDSAQSTKSGEVTVGGERFAEDYEQAKQSLQELSTSIEPYADQIEWLVFSHSGPIAGADALLNYTVE